MAVEDDDEDEDEEDEEEVVAVAFEVLEVSELGGGKANVAVAALTCPDAIEEGRIKLARA